MFFSACRTNDTKEALISDRVSDIHTFYVDGQLTEAHKFWVICLQMKIVLFTQCYATQYKAELNQTIAYSAPNSGISLWPGCSVAVHRGHGEHYPPQKKYYLVPPSLPPK